MNDPIEGNEQEDLMNFVAEMNDNPDSVQPETVEAVAEADKLLDGAFGFYGFGIKLNIEEQIDVANRAYIRFYKKKINDILLEKEEQEERLEAIDKVLFKLKQESAASELKIKELQLKEEIVMKERVSLK